MELASFSPAAAAATIPLFYRRAVKITRHGPYSTFTSRSLELGHPRRCWQLMSDETPCPSRQTAIETDHISLCKCKLCFNSVYLQPQQQQQQLYLFSHRFISRLWRDAGWSHRGVDGLRYKQENVSDVIAVHPHHFQRKKKKNKSRPLFITFIFFLKNNTNNIKWKRRLKIITMLQVSRFDNLKEEKKNTFTQKYTFIYLYSFLGDMARRAVWEETFDIEP